MPICHFNKKAIIAGNFIQVYEYENTQYYNFDKKFFENRVSRTCYQENEESKEDKKRDYKKESIDRAIKNVKLLIAANVNSFTNIRGKAIISRFITLTFNSHVTDEKEARKCFKSFNRKLKNKFNGTEPAYLGVYEKQNNGRLHLHVVYFNLPYINANDLSVIWGNGSITVKRIKGTANDFKNLGNYIKKAFEYKQDSKASYIRSRNLRKPIEVRNDYIVSLFKDYAKEQMTCSYEFQSEYTGISQYSMYDLSTLHELEKQKIKEILLD